MTEDEDDYMSDKFLNQSAESPGLFFSNKQRRDHDLYKKKHESTRSFQQISKEKTQEALKTALPETNKGFAMLKKMGYKPGSGLGKSDDGPCNPVAVELKEDKTGLGHKNEKREKEKLLQQTSFTTFRTTMKKRKEFSDLKYDYGRMRRACQLYDEKDNLKGPIKKWFWPDWAYTKKNSDKEEDKEESDEEDEDDSDDELEKSEMLSAEELEWRIEHIAVYLREKYNFCIWCGLRYDDEKEMLEACPGRTRYLHEDADRNLFTGSSKPWLTTAPEIRRVVNACRMPISKAELLFVCRTAISQCSLFPVTCRSLCQQIFAVLRFRPAQEKAHVLAVRRVFSEHYKLLGYSAFGAALIDQI